MVEFIDINITNFVFRKVIRSLSKLKKAGYCVDFPIKGNTTMKNLLSSDCTSMYKNENGLFLRVYVTTAESPSEEDIMKILDLEEASKAKNRVLRANSLKNKCSLCGVGIKGNSRLYNKEVVCELCFARKQLEIADYISRWVSSMGDDIKSLDSVPELADRGFYITRDGKIYGTKYRSKGKTFLEYPIEKKVVVHDNGLRICCLCRALDDNKKNLYYNVDKLVSELFV